jgi:hypothetical protein
MSKDRLFRLSVEKESENRLEATLWRMFASCQSHRSLGKVHPASLWFTVSGTLRHTLSSAGFITIMCGFRFSVQTAFLLKP